MVMQTCMAIRRHVRKSWIPINEIVTAIGLRLCKIRFTIDHVQSRR